MSFNPSKCQVLHTTRAKCPIQTKYIFHDTVLQTIPSAKYLGVTISDDLSWSPHIDLIIKKANQTLGFLKWNIKVQVHNQDLKSTAYKTLVRPQLEYASTVWSPHTATNIAKVEAVQRRAARWATRDYQRTSSENQMLKDLNWRTLELRRINSRLILMYKITYDLVAIPAADYLLLLLLILFIVFAFCFCHHCCTWVAMKSALKAYDCHMTATCGNFKMVRYPYW